MRSFFGQGTVRRLRAAVLGGLVALLPVATPVLAADTLQSPQGRVILTVSGAIQKVNGKGRARFDLTMIKALGTVTVRTATPWTQGVSEFEGVRLRDLLSAVGATGDTIHAVALNDYKVAIPVSDFDNHDVILAFKLDGRVLRVRDKGPLWVIYPWDDDPSLKTERYYARSIWQLNRVVVE